MTTSELLSTAYPVRDFDFELREYQEREWWNDVMADDPVSDAAITDMANAMRLAEQGDWTAIIGRAEKGLITTFEANALRRKLCKSKLTKFDELDAFIWLQETERLTQKAAFGRIADATGKSDDAVKKQISRLKEKALEEAYEPGPIFARNLDLYREGSRSSAIFPAVLKKTDSFREFMKKGQTGPSECPESGRDEGDNL